MGKTRQTGNLVANNQITVDTTNQRVGIGSALPNTTLDVFGNITATSTRFQSVGEETTRISGNTASLIYNTGGGNIAICTNPSGDITLAVTGIPVDSSFNDTSITFSVFVNQTGTRSEEHTSELQSH